MDRAALSALRASHGYPQFVLGATAARLADEMFVVGVVLLVLQRTDSPGLAGVTVAAATVPAIVSAPVIGAWLDRSGRRSLLLKVDRLLLIACLLGILAAAGHTPAFVVPLLGFTTGMTLPATFGGLTSFIPLLVEEDLLDPANTLEAASLNTATMVGPALAGTLSALAGPATSIAVECGLTMLALALLLRIPALDRGGTHVAEPLVRLIRKGIAFSAREPVIRAVTVTGLLQMATLGVLTVGFPLWAADDLGVSRSAAGHLWAAFAFGSLLGALAFSGLQQRIAQDQTFFLGMFGFGLIMLAWPLAPSLAVALVLVAVAAVADGPALSATFAVRQKRTPAALQSQVMTTLGGLKIGAFSVGAALAGPIVEALGPRTAIAALAATQLAGTAAGLALRAQGARSSMRRVSA